MSTASLTKPAPTPTPMSKADLAAHRAASYVRRPAAPKPAPVATS